MTARMLAWDAVFVHLTSALLFASVHVLIIVNSGDHTWWVAPLLATTFVVCMAGWFVQAQIVFRGTKDLRSGKETRRG